MSGALKARRSELGLNQTRAALAAGVSRSAWVRWENGDAEPFDYNYVLIERALKWEPGSVEEILKGGKPRPARVEHSPPGRLPIDEAALARYQPADRELILAVLRAAEARATRRHPEEVNQQREDPKGA